MRKIFSIPVLSVSMLFLSFCVSSTNRTKTENEQGIQKKNDTFEYIHRLAQFADTSQLDRFEEEIRQFEQQDSSIRYNPSTVLFLGSSSIRKWETLQEDMAPLQVLNRGFGGSTLPEAIYYFRRIVFRHQPKTIVLYEGDNDLTEETVSPVDVLETLKIFYDMTQFYLPETQIYFISIKPSVARKEIWDKMQETNKLIKIYAEKTPFLDFIDVSSNMLTPDGDIREDIFVKDNLHLNETGYKIWTKEIKQYLLPE